MPLPLPLDAILEKLQTLLEGETLYLHRLSGALELIEDETVAFMADLDEDLSAPAEVEYMDQVRAILISEHYIALPTPTGWDDPDLRTKLEACLVRAGLVLPGGEESV